MFSQNIQNYINNSSQAQAYNRANELNNYINTIYPKENIEKNKELSAFQEILAESKKETANSSGIFNLDLPPNIKSENAIKPLAFGTLTKKVEKTPSQNNVFSDVVKNVSNISSVDKKPASKDSILGYISEMSEKYGVEEKLIKALIKQESGFNPNAVSKAGAKGLMQLMPKTALSLGVKDVFNPRENIEGGVKYLKQMLDKYNGNKILAIAAYNAGPGAVDKYDGIPPYKETQNYVRSILANYL